VASEETELQAKIAWLHMIQAVITRMSNYGFMLKGWGVTLVAALLALSVGKDGNSNIAMLGILVSLVFWALDGWFLQTETRFRNLYDWATTKSALTHKFSFRFKHEDFDKDEDVKPVENLSRYVFSCTLLPFWGVLAVVCVLVGGWGRWG